MLQDSLLIFSFALFYGNLLFHLFDTMIIIQSNTCKTHRTKCTSNPFVTNSPGLNIGQQNNIGKRAAVSGDILCMCRLV